MTDSAPAPQKKSKRIAQELGFVILAFGCVFVLDVVLMWVKSSLGEWQRNYPGYPVRTFVGGFALFAGFVLFKLRILARRFYGFVEVVFGVTSACLLTFSKSEMDLAILSLVGCVYIITRGFTNIQEGYAIAASDDEAATRQ